MARDRARQGREGPGGDAAPRDARGSVHAPGRRRRHLVRRPGGSRMSALNRIWAIALNTFREAARIRVLYGILVLVVGANLLAILLGQLSLHEAGRVARDVGLAG